MPDNYFPLHPAQQDVYMDQLLNTDSPQYNIGGYIVLKGPLYTENFNQVLNSIPQVFDAFKMRFDLDASEPVYRYETDFKEISPVELDFSNYKNPVEEARSWMQQRFNTPFKLTYDTLPFEQFLIKINDDEHWFFGKYHHLITDGYGFIVYVKYIAEKYQALAEGREFSYNYPQYQQEIIKANEYYHSSEYREDGNYWKNKIPANREKLLQKKYTSSTITGKIGATYNFNINEEQRKMLEVIQTKSKAGLQQLTIAALLIYFGKTSSSSEFILGIPIHKRGSRQLRNTVGMFSGIIPFKGSYNPEQTLSDLLKDISSSQRSDYRHQNYLIGDLSRELKINPSDGYLADVIVNYEPLDFELDFGEEIKATIVRLANEDERNPLQLCWRDYNKQQSLQLQVQFGFEYFTPEEIDLLARRILFIIGQFSDTLDQPVESISILPAEEEARLLQFNNSKIKYPSNRSIVDLFEEQASNNAESTAIIFEHERLSYRELNERANQLARYLVKKGLKPESLVPICLERNLETIVGIFGVLKAGGAYVHIDLDYPQDRISYILEDTNAKLILSNTVGKEKLKQNNVPVIEIDGDWNLIGKESMANMDIKLSPGLLAYVMYTSGSTGRPKGVMVEHKSVVRLVKSTNYIEISATDTILSLSNFSFDGSVFDIFGALLNGASVVVLVKEAVLDLKQLSETIDKKSINIFFLTTALFNSLVDSDLFYFQNLKYVLFGGEQVSLKHVKRFKKTCATDTKLIHVYGPTENTTFSSYYVVDEINEALGTISIGSPVSNTEIYILNKDQQLQPIGVSGEICVGGEGLARGYLNRPDLTAEKFIGNPHGGDAGSKLYCTGDIGRWLTDGNVEFLGRIDDQVKIRGYRIELGEIESAITVSKLVSQAVVMAKEDINSGKRLVAYIVAAEGFDKSAIEEYLSEKLPEYMIPKIWVQLDILPLTPNGKIDKKVLPDPETADISTAYLAPRTPAEVTLARIWQELLVIEKVGINDNFFELGGHSLLAMRVVSAIRKQLEVELLIRDIFTHPTIALLSAYLNNQGKNQTKRLIPAIQVANPRPEYIPLSFSQERLWFIDQLEGSIQYHIPAVLRLKGFINKDALKSALKNIIDRHEVLRTTFSELEGHAYQVLMNADLWKLTVVEGAKYENDAELLQTYIKELINQPFDLNKDYMLRARLISINSAEHILVVVIHHIASDGWSLSVLVRELVELYNAGAEGRPSKLPPLAIQYADYAIWQQSWLRGEALDQRLSYWKQKLQGVTALELPPDYVRPAVQRMRGALKNIKLDKKLKSELTSLGHAQQVTLYMTLLATFKVLLYRYSSQEDICVGTGIAGRQQQDIENLIGFFVNTLALRSNVNGELPFTTFLQAVKTTTLEAYEHQEVPFEKVVDAIVKERDLSRNPLFQVMFMVQNTPDIPEISLGAVDISPVPFEQLTSRFDLTFTITEVADELDLEVEYDTDLFKAGTIARMMQHYKELLYSVVSRPQKQIGQLGMMSQAEEAVLLHEFNNTKTLRPPQKNIILLFEEQVRKNPDAIAVVFENHQLTYNELNVRANQLAHYLRDKGVAADTLIPICLERSLEMMVGVLGILKAGGAYVPIDPVYPVERIKYLLDDTEATIVLSAKTNGEKLRQASIDLDIIQLDEKSTAFSKQPVNNPDTVIKPDNLAYVIYTSGSTGKPKGVMIEHSSMVNYLLNSKTTYINNEGDDSGSFIHLSYTFDASLTAMFMPILSGKVIVISSKNAIDVFEDTNLLKYAPYDFIKITPAHLDLIHPKLKGAGGELLTRRLVIGGEALFAGHFANVIEDSIEIEIINEYGPTEATVGCSTYSFSPISDYEEIKKNISIGKPIDNTQLYILDDKNDVVAIGIVGQLCIGGEGLSRGYLNLPELTAEKFIDNPFNKEKGSRLYKTGDMGRWLPDGNIEYLGRVDDQVKVRGYRIELGEIENVLNQCDRVSQAVVLAKQDSQGDKKLLSYYVPDWQSVKDKEHDHYLQQVATWKELYEIEYGKTEDLSGVDEEFNIIGWDDSFTGLPMPADHMRLWLDDTVNLVLSENPGKVLEIGCGTGLIFYQLAGKVEKYLGADLSISSINQITSRINKGLKDYGPVELWVSPAHEITLPDGENVDTILLNSMVQYFPGEGYMNDVIDRALSLLNGQGRIIIGDVRDNRLLAMFKMRLQMQKLQSTANIQELNWAVEQEVLKEEELCLSPEYFYRLQSLYPQITYIDIEWKHGDYINELTLYRYNVVIYVGIERPLINPDWQSWNATGKQNILNQLNDRRELVAIKDAPSQRLWKEKLLHNAVQQNVAGSLGDLAQIVESEDDDTLWIREVISVAEANGYQYRFLLDEDLFKVNILFETKRDLRFVENVYSERTAYDGEFYANIPLFMEISTELKKDIRFFLQQRLPDYMVPQDFVAVSQLPLTNNGKVDRRFLGQREEVVLRNTLNYQPASTAAEQKLVSIWQELLNVDRIGIYDNFFDLGGHSLLATRLVSAIRKQMEVELAIKEVFNYPTIASLASYVDAQNKGLSTPAIVSIHPRPDYIPLSFSQERLWFIDRLEGSVQYHVPAVLRLKGELSKEGLEHTLRAVINRHEVLRTVIIDHQGQGYQQIMSADKWRLTVTETSFENERDLTTYITGLISKPFDLSADFMLRAELIKIEDNDHMLVITMHHIASDGWSISILVKEVAEIYEAYAEDRKAQLPLLPVQYADYAIWQRSYLDGEILENKLNYWKAKLTDVTTLQLPTDYSRPVIQSSRGAIHRFSINKNLSARLQALTQSKGTTLFMTLLAAFKVLLYRYSGQEDVCVGTPVAGRNQQELEGLIGFFINTLALRGLVKGDMSFNSLLEEVKITTLKAYGHQEVPFEKVVDAVAKTRDRSRSPLFQVMFSLQNTPEVPELKLGQLNLSTTPAEEATAKFDIAFLLNETGSGILGTVEYNTDLYKEETIKRLVNHYLMLLESIIVAPGEKVGSIKMLQVAEEQVLLNEFNNTTVNYLKEKNLVTRFEEQVVSSPGATAIIFGEEKLTYGELNERSNQLAHYLVKQGIRPETLIPICIERNANMVVGLLGILKAGAAYVPIDPDYPQERISYMLEDTGAKLVISSKTARVKLNEGLSVIELDGDRNQIAKEQKGSPEIPIDPCQLAYVIYTSGSTGRPKGVMIEHRNANAFIAWCQTEFAESTFDVVYATTSICFDLSVFELFYPLSTGKPVRILANGLAIPNYVTKDIAVLVNTVPSVVETLLNEKVDLSRVSVLNMAGEPIPARVSEMLDTVNTEVRNLYGPTEDTTYSTKYKLVQGQPVLIGTPIANTKVYLLSKDHELSPVGVSGEICIGGSGLARGYLNKPELTAEKFIQDRFSTDPKARLYKTGDLGRWLPDGNIEYLGRMDDQVKIRGYRIELGEIETILNQNEMISQGIVLAKEDKQGTKRLIGYVVAGGTFDKQAIQNYLSAKLPDYMVPAIWVQLETIPLTPNGKIDRKALPDPEMVEIKTEYVAPRNEIEVKLAVIWQDLLQTERAGIYDNFFEVGGHSLLAMRVVSAIERDLSVSIPINILFQFNSISELSKYIEFEMKSNDNAIENSDEFDVVNI